MDVTIDNGSNLSKDKVKKRESLGLTIGRDVNFSEWYQQTVTKTQMIEYTDISGCYILRPNSYAIWEEIQKFFDSLIKKDGVKNTYFPCFVTKKAIEFETENFEGFSPEIAWITKYGTTDLHEPIGLRPTSEAIIYPTISKWIRSYQDLPLRLNQWCNVVRWEMKRCIPFIRSREFLWQEGHSSFATKQEADQEVFKILDFYKCVYENLLAIPVTQGKKTDREKFAGAEFTTTIEIFVGPTGRSIQGATSHSLGQKFSKVLNIWFEDDKHNKCLVWQNSWGMSTRSIGAMVMIHGDDKGLRLPPRVAPIQVIIVPIFNKNNEKMIDMVIDKICSCLLNIGVRVEIDKGNGSPGWKYNYWEMRGIPIRLEIGQKEIETSTVVTYRRDQQTKERVHLCDLSTKIPSLLNDIHNHLYSEANKIKNKNTIQLLTFSEFIVCLNNKCVALVPFCLTKECEDNIKIRSKNEYQCHDQNSNHENENENESIGCAKSLCRPLDQPTLVAGTKCFGECGKYAKEWCLFGRSY